MRLENINDDITIEDSERNKGNKKINVFITILWGITTFIFLLLGFSIKWGMKTWTNLSMEEMVYTLTSSIKGTGNGMIADYAKSCILPSFCIIAVIITIFVEIFIHTNSKFFIRAISLIISIAFCGLYTYKFWTRLDITAYIENQNASAEFIEAQYINPQNVTLSFPKQKRNLIYIFLESVETTFADTENGGAFNYNCIPELTYLAQNNEDFSGNNKSLNGGYSFTGSTWTMGALFAQTAGIPLQISISGNSMGTQDHFFPGITNLGDILNYNGYNQIFMIGSDAEFGGRKLFFEEHGNYQIKDYYYAIENSLISSDYKVSWGYEDKKLFDFAKEEILKIADLEQPFNFTLLTVDTHFEDGYLCEDCNNEFGDNQYANVYACSSKKIAEFVEWIQQQEFYTNTTIVLVGDHPTMDSDFCNDISKDYDRRTYTCFINPGCENLQPDVPRSFSTLDMFPTTLAALGVKIEGERLGLGTNLFSKKQTLIEEFGLSYVSSEVAKQSSLLAEMAAIDKTTDSYLQSIGTYPSAQIQTEYLDDENIAITISNIQNLDNITSVEIEIKNDQNNSKTVVLDKKEDVYITTINKSEYNNTTVEFTIYITDVDRKYNIGTLSGDFSLYTNNFGEYLSYLSQKDYAVFFTIRDEGTSALDTYSRAKLMSLGLTIDLNGQTRSSYYALIENKTLICEEISQERISNSGTLADGTSYTILSSGFNSGSDCSVRIDGKEYSIGTRGLNIVVYDNNTHKVIDSVCFDTYTGKNVTRGTGSIETNFLENKNKCNFIQDENLQSYDFCEYLKAVKANRNYIILLAIKDEGTYGLTTEMKELLKEIGLQTDFTDKFRMSYYAVVDSERIIENLGETKIETFGTLSNGAFYTIRSEGYTPNGSKCSVTINGTEFAVNSRGMNIVIYDKEDDCVVDSVAFDTYDKAAAKRN